MVPPQEPNTGAGRAARRIERVTLLIDFLCRFGGGLALALCLTSTTLVPGGFFRVNLLVVLGLATFAGLLAWTVGLSSVGWLMAITAVTAWVGSILMYAERRRGGLICCGLAAACGGLAAVIVGNPAASASVPRLLSGCLIGLTVNAMLLGHWYLNAPGMRVDALRRSIDQTLVVWALLLVVTLVGVGWQFTTAGAAGTGWLDRSGAAVAAAAGGGTAGLDQTGLALLWLRWLAGLVGLPVLLVMSRKTLDIPNTQSATGILYVACLAVILGELTAQLLAVPSAPGVVALLQP
jgi:hypothetical protein